MTGDPSDNQVEPMSVPSDVLPYAEFSAPEPLETEPPTLARWLAFTGILIGGLLGGLIGFGTSDLLGFPRLVSSFVALAFATGCAVGVGIVAQLTLRAMNEWNAVHHPEDQR
jgi:hypothetical protein